MTLLALILAVNVWRATVQQHEKNQVAHTGEYAETKPPDVVGAEKPDERIARYTLWLTIFTGLLAVVSAVQINFLRRADKTATIAAYAAKASADMIPNIERPYVLISELNANTLVGVAGVSEIRYLVDITFRNYGRTPANVALLEAYVRILDHIPTDADAPKPQPPGETAEIIIGADKPWIFKGLTCLEVLDAANLPAFMTGKLHLYCWGRLEYRSIFEKTHPTDFCRRFNRQNNQFSPVGPFERNRAS